MKPPPLLLGSPNAMRHVNEKTVADGGGGSITYSYGTVGSQQNDVLVTQKPAPTGENTKARQLESDGLGRLTSPLANTVRRVVGPLPILPE